MTASKPQEYLSITSEELLIVEHGCIYPDKDECIGKHCKYHDPNPSFRDNVVCLLNEHDVADRVRSRPNSSQPVPDSTTLMQMAETEWHNREERFGLHDAISWTTGWMAGYLTPNKPDWSKEHDAAIRKAERERVLGLVIPTLGQAIQTDISDNDYVMIEDLESTIESLRGGEQR